MKTKTTAEFGYLFNVNYADTRIATLSLDGTTHFPKLEYNQYWQNSGFAISPNLTLDNKHSAAVAYHYLDNALPEGDARALLAENLGVSEKNVYSQVLALGNDLAGAVTFTQFDQQNNHLNQTTQPIFRRLGDDELTVRLDSKEALGMIDLV